MERFAVVRALQVVNLVLRPQNRLKRVSFSMKLHGKNMLEPQPMAMVVLKEQELLNLQVILLLKICSQKQNKWQMK